MISNRWSCYCDSPQAKLFDHFGRLCKDFEQQERANGSEGRKERLMQLCQAILDGFAEESMLAYLCRMFWLS